MAPKEKAAAKERMFSGTPAKVSQGSAARATDKIGSFAGVSGRTVEKIAAVVKAAEEKGGRDREGPQGGALDLTPAESGSDGRITSRPRH